MSTTAAAVTPPPSDCATAPSVAAPPAPAAVPGASPDVDVGVVNFKNRLQEFTQRASIPYPVYETSFVSGPNQQPQFRSSVSVDGERYTSNIFMNKKAAEQDAAKHALEGIDKKIKDSVSKKTTTSGFPPIFQDKIFSKSILHEFAAKMNMEMPKYESVKEEGVVSLFIANVVFNGVKYVGAPSINKKEAEQLAARNAIISILADSGIGTHLSEVVKSKAKLFSMVHEDIRVNDVPSVPYVPPNARAALDISAMKGDCQDSQTGSATENVLVSDTLEQPLSRKSGLEGVDGAGNVFGNVVSGILEGQTHAVPRHEFRKPGLETPSQGVPLPIAFVPSLGDQTPLHACGQKRNSKKKKKANKKAKLEETQVSELPLNQ